MTLEDSIRAIENTLQNFAVCRELIGDEGYMKSGDFEANLLLCFGERDTTKEPIEDLFDKATKQLLTLIDNQLIEELGSIKEEAEGIAKFELKAYAPGAIVDPAKIKWEVFEARLKQRISNYKDKDNE